MSPSHLCAIYFQVMSISILGLASLLYLRIIIIIQSSSNTPQVLLSLAKTVSLHVIVVDARPQMAGLQTLKILSRSIHCTYTPLSGAAAAMRNVSRVILGASALLSNGSMIAAAGTAMVAALAKLHRIPVIVAAESYKFCEKVQLDAIVYNGNFVVILLITFIYCRFQSYFC